MKLPVLYSTAQFMTWAKKKRARQLSLLDEAIGNIRDMQCPLRKRFWLRVQKGRSCWEWQGGITQSGYGRFHCMNDEIPAHRISYLLTKGDIPRQLLVLHHCDNKRCVRPTHLFVGTTTDNMRDALRKGLMNLNGLKLGPKTPKRFYRGKLLSQKQ